MYLNIAGMFGWYVYGKILKHQQLPQQLCNRFNLVLPLLKLERPLAHFAGLSLITVGQKMYTETEIKLPIKDLQEAHQNVANLNTKLHKERYFEDNYVLDTSDLSVRNSGCMLRVRIMSSRSRILYARSGNPDIQRNFTNS